MSTRRAVDDLPPLDAETRLLAEAVREAGRVALGYFRHRPKMWEKRPNDPVSEADLAVNESLRATLGARRPDYGWLSEEDADDTARLGARRTWVVDPIDGTRAFLQGRDCFVVSAALVEDGRPVAAAICRPTHDNLYSAWRGGGAWLNDRPIRVSDTDRLDDARVLGDEDWMHSKRLWPVPWPRLRCRGDCNAIALRICLVAAGDYDATVSLRPSNDWDVAAAELILEEAGGVCITGMGHPHAYNSPKPKPPFVVAAAPGVSDAVMERMVPALERRAERKARERG
ncbi:hypothetical protein CCR85_00550 [Rhodothalassium salexigens]|uniref:3'(2'),5'-bisphosphate nucleotidase CysQ n=1 Tax=Rhodothalassium salexigens TaxID=1086 RepID=UPI0019134791|nr:3'(2'),5'-bisphosphate nucleotidase CysQ [Rhodothalassium salexigens]MBK5909983.1 hypothetical protein [Rhodothalassium salexigens]